MNESLNKSSLFIREAELNGALTDVYIEGNRIRRIAPLISPPPEDATVINARGKALIPGLMNMHTHAAMTLFRGFADDMPLEAWLNQKIWPNEAKLSDEHVYWGSKLACVEMLRSGTTTFFDMYYHPDATRTAVEEMGLRAVVSEVCFDHFDAQRTEQCKRHLRRRFQASHAAPHHPRIRQAIGPHAIYTVSGELLRWICAFADEQNVPVQIHLAETEAEVRQCQQQFGATPVRYLRTLGVLSPRLSLAHALYVDEEEIAILADHDVKVVHNPASNMKLASGYRFRFEEMRAAGLTVGLGTDGCASSNNLDLIEAMKLAALLGKVWRKDPQAVSCEEVFRAATQAGAIISGWTDGGRVAEGCLADLCLIDLHTPAFTPNFNFVSNLVYAANGSCVDTVICDGKIRMLNRIIPDEDRILEHAAQIAYDTFKMKPRIQE
jgi:5-methylthioadenosine/S-adenosylhomocysteine deaminase